MLLRIALLVTLCAPPWAAAIASDGTFPYTAYINADDVYVRSGPGTNYYPTSKLHRGEAVEIYRHDPGGWYAVRPPEGSFSWVAGEYLQPVEDLYAEVTGDRVVARVGTEFSDTRDVIQVRLYRGEEVEIVEAKRFGDGPGAQTWYKITPPAGEFRWIHGEYVDRGRPALGPRREDYAGNLIIEKIEQRTSGASRPSGEGVRTESHRLTAAYGDDASDRGDAPRRLRAAEVREPLDGDVEESLAERRERLAARRERSMARRNEIEPARRPAEARVPPESEFQGDELDEIDFALSSMVTGEPETWQLGPLFDRVEAAFARSETALDRGRARLLLKRLQRFEEIQYGYREIAARPALPEPRERQVSYGQQHGPRVDRPAAPGTGRYDGVGRLTQVDSSRPYAPNYALVGPNGSVQYYVTPAPGLNLRHYVGREVGLNGSLGYVPELGSQHVMAKRVTVLDGRVLR